MLGQHQSGLPFIFEQEIAEETEECEANGRPACGFFSATSVSSCSKESVLANRDGNALKTPSVAGFFVRGVVRWRRR
jgi:hypothetical protein